MLFSALVVAIICIGILSLVPAAKLGRVFRIVALLVLCSASGFAYGTGKQILTPTTDPYPLDAALKVTATVSSVEQLQQGQRIVLSIRRISRMAQATSSHAVNFSADWLLWGQAAQKYVSGETLVLTGTLALPPISSSTGTAVRAELLQMGIHYDFQGDVLTTTSPVRWEESTLAAISRGMVGIGIGTSDRVLLESIVFGHQSRAPAAPIHQAFLRSGLLHVLAASGANVFFIEGFLWLMLLPLRWFFSWFHLPQTILRLAVVGMTWVFCGLCGFQSSITRATLMSSYRSLGKIAGRQPSVWNGLFIAALVLTVMQPNEILSPASGLSFVATAAVQRGISSILQTQRTQENHVWRRVFRVLWHNAITSVRVSVTVELYLLPLEIFWFQQITPLSVLSNFVAEPILALLLPVTALLMVLGMLHLLLPHLLTVDFCHVFLLSDIALLHLLVHISQWLGHFPQSLYKTNPISIVDILSYYLVLMGIPLLVKRLKWDWNL